MVILEFFMSSMLGQSKRPHRIRHGYKTILNSSLFLPVKMSDHLLSVFELFFKFFINER